MSADIIPLPAFGATPADWQHFDIILGLTADLLPVVSNPRAEISPDSKMKATGKTPSIYNGAGKVVGLSAWTSKQSTPADIERWSRMPDLGICLQTRTVRALDCDIDDPTEAAAVARIIAQRVGVLPCRMRDNADKFLLAFTLPGEMVKRVIKTQHGIIEFLATGQQFVACGTHPSGSRYRWVDGLPEEFPTLTLDQFEDLWSLLAATFAVEPPVEGQASTKAQQLAEAAVTDPVGKYLIDNGWVKSTERDGRLHIRCPFESEHTTESPDSATSYFPAHTGGYAQGHFKCLHAHCAGRANGDFINAIGASAADFEEVVFEEPQNDPESPVRQRFEVIPAHEFAQGKPPAWIVKDVLPDAELVVVFGESGSGKSFFVLDLLGAIAQGIEWRGKRVRQGSAVYIAAEGAGGFRNRLRAYAAHDEIDLADLPIGVIGDAPNLMKVDDVKAIIAAIKVYGRPSVVVVDTFAQAMPGSNENSGEDVGRALGHCKAIRRATGAMVILVHHAGKDSSKGARGWSGLRAAADAEIEIVRADNDRVATVTKLKDGEDGAEFGFKLRTVPVGVDDDGDVISSCTVEHTAAIPKAQRGRDPKGVIERLCMRVLAEMQGLSGDEVQANDHEEAVKAQIPAPEEGKRDRRVEHIRRAVRKLIEEGVLAERGTRIKIVSDEQENED